MGAEIVPMSHADARDAPDGPFAHVVSCVDGDPGDAAGIAAGLGLAGDRGRLSVVHVAGAGDTGRASRLVQDAVAAAPGAEAVILHGPPGPAICRWAEATDAGLLVVASRHPGRWGMSVIGPVTRYLIDHAPCAILVVRHGEG
jgi:nucleotide-binding universal stress UspA family protein